MKKTRRIIGVVAVMVMSLSMLMGCNNSIGRSFSNSFSKSEIIYQATTRFLYSTDGGASWSETIQEIPINTTYYLAVEMQVTQSEETKELPV